MKLLPALRQAAILLGRSLLLISFVARVVAADQPAPIRFNDHIRPILAENCLACHGPDTASREADLRLDTGEGAIASGLIVPGQADESELIARIISDDPDEQMPPPDSGKKLSSQQKQLLVRWIDDGAAWEKHWSFIPPRRPTLPPVTGAKSWARNPIDHFVLAKLQQLGLTPNDGSDRHSLARRVALDIIGLPPNDEQLNAYLNDARDDAFSSYVDRLLQSRHAGEHRARYWLDAARYGDTHGMHFDNYREIWPYRDWVVRSFNQNRPFDQFVFQEIAGGLMPTPTLEQRIATGFNRCNITTSEGGSITAELDVRYMVDRVETTATVFLALTAGCAVCHDHKYDPITQREFYELGAFFNNTTQPAMDGNVKDTPPVVVLPAEQFREEWNKLQEQRVAMRRELDAWKTPAVQWWQTRDRNLEHPIHDDQLVLSLPLTEGESDWPPLPEMARWAESHPAGRRGIRFTGEVDLQREFPQLSTNEPLTVSFWFRTPDIVTSTTIFEQRQTIEDDKTIGWKITTNAGNALTFEMNDRQGNRIRGMLPTNEGLRPRHWQHVCVRYSGGQSNSSVSIFAGGRAAVVRGATESLLEANTLAEAPLKIAGELPTAGLSDVRIYRRWVSDEEVQLLAHDRTLIQQIVSDHDWSDLDAKQQQLTASYFRQTSDENYRERSRRYAETTLRRDYMYAQSTTTLVMEERPETPRAWVLERGEYTKRREEVAPNVPAVLPPLPADLPRNRLALAQWLTDPDHPLVARVMVNRLWQSVFGIGLVKSTEDFGVMGDRPSHPDLLDWLAVEFVESGWNVNHMIKLMVTSSAYRQSGMATPAKLLADPENRFLARGPRHRLDAELLRDQVLAVSGLLCREVGGPSVKPRQPDGLWNVVAITGSNTRAFQRDTGDALYRRSMYTFWKRTSPPPSMAAFNAPTREQCTVRRERTNTPLQALVMMNDPQFVEGARFLAQRTLLTATDDQGRATSMLWAVLRRSVSAAEIDEIKAMAQSFREIFQQSPEGAKQLIATGDTPVNKELDAAELAAWTMIASTMMKPR